MLVSKPKNIYQSIFKVFKIFLNFTVYYNSLLINLVIALNFLKVSYKHKFNLIYK